MLFGADQRLSEEREREVKLLAKYCLRCYSAPPATRTHTHTGSSVTDASVAVIDCRPIVLVANNLCSVLERPVQPASSGNSVQPARRAGAAIAHQYRRSNLLSWCSHVLLDRRLRFRSDQQQLIIHYRALEFGRQRDSNTDDAEIP